MTAEEEQKAGKGKDMLLTMVEARPISSDLTNFCNCANAAMYLLIFCCI